MSYIEKKIDVSQFKTIDDLYLFIDQNADVLTINTKLTDICVDYRVSTSSDYEKKLAQCELECHLFFGRDINQLFSFNSIIKFDELNNSENIEYDYLPNPLINWTNFS